MNNQGLASVNGTVRQLAPADTATPSRLAIANAVVRANKEMFGRGPTKARVIVDQNVVMCVLADCLTTAERTLVQNGRSERVALLRHEMNAVARPKLMRIVEEVTGRRVTATTAGIDLEADQQVTTFTLDGPLEPLADDSRGVR